MRRRDPARDERSGLTDRKPHPAVGPSMDQMKQHPNSEIARAIQGLRAAAGLSQRALARRVGTTASVICRLEDASYDGHSLGMLKRVAAALDQRLEIRFVPADTSTQPPE